MNAQTSPKHPRANGISPVIDIATRRWSSAHEGSPTAQGDGGRLRVIRRHCCGIDAVGTSSAPADSERDRSDACSSDNGPVRARETHSIRLLLVGVSLLQLLAPAQPAPVARRPRQEFVRFASGPVLREHVETGETESVADRTQPPKGGNQGPAANRGSSIDEPFGRLWWCLSQGIGHARHNASHD